ncbi:MAG: hypothetical protein CMI90_03445 [Pelagibacteraceae bacterium]|nr:hypothetical protein [Pelagibacteraceae bacterium]|tara:strand:- start:799 stop:1020 length:222 start_codon:yes stop_codon:yes gene_type:complete
MSKPIKDKATGDKKSGNSNINNKYITDFISDKDKLLIKFVKLLDNGLNIFDLMIDLKSDYKKLKPFIFCKKKQ